MRGCKKFLKQTSPKTLAMKKQPRARLKPLMVAMLLAFTSWTHVSGQSFPLILANNELRGFFSTVSNPNPNVDFLYDMSAHLVDSAFFGQFVTDTSTSENWFNLYEEMYYAAYDTTQFLRASQVNTAAQVFVQAQPGKRIPLGIMDWDYNLLKPDALTTNIYFDFDTINNVITDKPGAPSPYTVQNVFAGAPLENHYQFADPTFQISPQFIFRDPSKDYSKGVFQVNFNDGSGWHSFDGNVTSVYTANWAGTGAGEKIIEFRYLDLNGNTLKYSLSKFFIWFDVAAPTPTSVRTFPGITASFYSPNCTVNAERKYVIYVEGIDPLDERDGPSIYHDMIYDTRMSQLQNFGYTFVIIDWDNSYAPMQINSANLQNVIDFLKCNGGVDRNVPPPPFVIVGESMGGVITRHALASMESQNYLNSQGCLRNLMHNTRLFISQDAPQQGASIPLGLQYLYQYITQMGLPLNALTLGAFSQYLNLLNGSASQLLIYHVATDQNANAGISSSTFGAHPNRVAFNAQLAALGNYPRFCKMVALSNGSALGANQIRRWDGAFRQPNDELLAAGGDIVLRILGIRVVGSSYNLQVRTNPAGNGDLFWFRHVANRWRIRIRWFSVRLVWVSSTQTEIDKDGQNLQPFCVSAGGRQGRGTLFQQTASNSFNFLSLFGYTTNSGNGNLNLQVSVGFPWLANLNGNFHAYSDGAEFGFIPVQSSYDYQAQPLNHNILAEPVGVTMGRTPFHALYLNTARNAAGNGINLNHVNLTNRVLGNCATCVTQGYPIRSYLLNREIGDDTLWLENMNAGYPFRFIEAEQSLRVNVPNPYYNYPGFNSALPAFEHLHPSNIATIKSRQQPFAITNTGPNTFRSNVDFIPNGLNPSTYTYSSGAMTICCVNYSVPNARMARPERLHQGEEVESSLLIAYPNPNAGDALSIKYRFAENLPVTLELYDVMGRKLGVWNPSSADHSAETQFHLPLQVQPGLYTLKATNGTEQQAVRLVITR